MKIIAKGTFETSKVNYPKLEMWGLKPRLIDDNVWFKNDNGIITAAKYNTFLTISVCSLTKKEAIMKTAIPNEENIPLEIMPVFPDSSPRAISLVTQYDAIGSINVT